MRQLVLLLLLMMLMAHRRGAIQCTVRMAGRYRIRVDHVRCASAASARGASGANTDARVNAGEGWKLTADR